MTTITGASQYFFLAIMNRKNSLKKLTSAPRESAQSGSNALR